MWRRDGGEGSTIGEHPLVSPQGMLDQHRRGQVGVNPNGKQAVLDQGEVFPGN
jgi:hypothetical protein